MENISFHIGGTEQHDEIIKFLNDHFLPYEPMNVSIDLVPPGYSIPYFDRMVRSHLARSDTCVVMARDTCHILLGLAVFITESDR